MLKTDKNFRLSKTTKRILCSIVDSSERNEFKRMMIQAQLAGENARRESQKSRKNKNNVNTVPVIFGKKKTINLVNIILLFNTINILSLIKIYDNYIYEIPVLFLVPYLFDLLAIKKKNYDKIIIKNTIKNTTIPMCLMLLSFCLISYLIPK